MDYQGLTPDDLANINELNHAFLAGASASRGDVFRAFATHKLSVEDRTRLARVPFLLFSLREDDEDYWQKLLHDEPQFDLIESGQRPILQVRRLQVAGLCFLWQLARVNPYAVRLVCGASVAWCERLSQVTLVGLLQRAAERRDLLRLRFENDDIVWSRLLMQGRSGGGQARAAAQHCALQLMLIRRSMPGNNRLSAAACAIRGSGQAAMRQRARSIREPKV